MFTSPEVDTKSEPMLSECLRDKMKECPYKVISINDIVLFVLQLYMGKHTEYKIQNKVNIQSNEKEVPKRQGMNGTEPMQDDCLAKTLKE